MRKVRRDTQGLKYRLQQFGWYRPIHLAYTGWRARRHARQAWQPLLSSDGAAWFEALGAARGKARRILLATGAGGHLPSLTMESLLAVALTLRGSAVDVLLCDAALPACMMSEINWYADLQRFAAHGPRDRCASCHAPAAAMIDGLGIDRLPLSATLHDPEREQAHRLASSLPREELAHYVRDGVPLGEHAQAGALRFFARAQLADDRRAEQILRRYFAAALITHAASRRLFRSGRYDVVVLNHGIYVPQGVIAETARREGVRVVTWHPAYRRQCFIFSHGETYHRSLMTESVSEWESMAWSPQDRARIESYLASRWRGDGDWIKFHHAPELQVETLQREIGVDLSRPTIGLLTNVAWDAQLHYPANAFPGMMDWMLKTIAWFRDHPALQLLIRVHPAELTGTLPSRQPAMTEIANAFPQLPANVFVIPPDSRLSTYVAMLQCNAVIVYGTKMGVELSAAGMPVIVAGEAWVRGKGVTIDACSEQDYFDILGRLPIVQRLAPEVQERALKYAYHFFFRRMIPVKAMQPVPGWPPFRIAAASIDPLLPGRCDGLDLICEGIVRGRPFVFPAERLLQG